MCDVARGTVITHEQINSKHWENKFSTFY